MLSALLLLFCTMKQSLRLITFDTKIQVIHVIVMLLFLKLRYSKSFSVVINATDAVDNAKALFDPNYLKVDKFSSACL